MINDDESLEETAKDTPFDGMFSGNSIKSEPQPPAPQAADSGETAQQLHLFVILDSKTSFNAVVYEGVIAHSKVSNRAVEIGRLFDRGFRTQVYDAEVFTEQEAREDMKHRFNIDPNDENFYPLHYEPGDIGELQQIHGIRPEYTPSDIPFDALIKWKNEHVAAAKRYGQIRGEG